MTESEIENDHFDLDHFDRVMAEDEVKTRRLSELSLLVLYIVYVCDLVSAIEEPCVGVGATKLVA